MKKMCFVLLMVCILILGNVTAVLADAVTYDMQKADYYVYVATPDGGLNMRKGPGTNYDKVMSERIPDGVRLYIGYVSSSWGLTTYNGNEGWVALSQTTTALPQAESYKKEKTDYYVYVATPDGGLNMRKGPGTSYEKVMSERIPDNVCLHIEYVSGNWGYTAYNGNAGWVALSQTTTTPPQTQIENNTVESSDEKTPDVNEEEEIKPAENKAAEEIEQTKADDEIVIKKSMLSQIILAAVLLLFIIVISVLVLIIVNLKAKK